MSSKTRSGAGWRVVDHQQRGLVLRHSGFHGGITGARAMEYLCRDYATQAARLHPTHRSELLTVSKPVQGSPVQDLASLLKIKGSHGIS